MRFWIKGLFFLSFCMSIGSIFPSSFPFVKPLALFGLWALFVLEKRLKIPVHYSLFYFAFSLKPLFRSIRALPLKKHLALLPLFTPLFLFPTSFFWIPLTICAPLFLLISKKAAPHHHLFSFPEERAHYLDPKYPLFRKTEQFLGKKRFDANRQEKPHVIFCFLESFRAKNIGALGAKLPFSPNFDQLSQEGVLFSQFYANGMQTYRALISSLCGVPAQIETMSLRPFCDIPMISLAHILKKEGYDTAHFQGNATSFDWSLPFLKKNGFDLIRGEEHFPNHKKGNWGLLDEELFNLSYEHLQKANKPTFLSLFTISNHHPWTPIQPYPVPKHLPKSYQNFLQTFAYTDECLGSFIHQLKKGGLFEKSLIFIMADHGQKVEDGSCFQADLSDENAHIPLLILNGKKKLISSPGSQIDLLPTVLDLLNIQATHHSLGKSLAREGIRNTLISSAIKPFSFRTVESKDPNMKASHYFSSIEMLFKEKKLSPPQNIVFEKKAPPYARDDWLFSLNKEKPCISLDLSHSYVTNQGFHALSEEKTKQILEINLSHSIFLKDDALFTIAQKCPHLTSLNLSFCPFITEEGIHFLLQKLKLTSLQLEGNQNIEKLGGKNSSSLEEINLKGCVNFTAKGLINLSQIAPHIKSLSVSWENVNNRDVEKMEFRSLKYLLLEKSSHICPKNFHKWLKNNPDLEMVYTDRLEI